jgi:hypothetical protein
MRDARRRMFFELLTTLIDLAHDNVHTVEGNRHLAEYHVAWHGTKTHPEVVAVAGYMGVVEGYTEDGRFLREEGLKHLGEQLHDLARHFAGEVLILPDQPPFNEETGQFEA